MQEGILTQTGKMKTEILSYRPFFRVKNGFARIKKDLPVIFHVVKGKNQTVQQVTDGQNMVYLLETLSSEGNLTC
jgi:hypothetical protein